MSTCDKLNLVQNRQPSRFVTAVRYWRTDLEVIKLEYSLKLKMMRNDWLLADTRFHTTVGHLIVYLESIDSVPLIKVVNRA